MSVAAMKPLNDDTDSDAKIRWHTVISFNDMKFDATHIKCDAYNTLVSK